MLENKIKSFPINVTNLRPKRRVNHVHSMKVSFVSEKHYHRFRASAERQSGKVTGNRVCKYVERLLEIVYPEMVYEQDV